MSEAVEGEIVETPSKPQEPQPEELHPDGIELGAPGRGGRPSDMTPEVVSKLIVAFQNSYNVTEACFYADIARSTYYRWLADDDRFSYKMSQAQAALNSKAKANVAAAIRQGDPAISLRVLMVKDPDYKPGLRLEPPNKELPETRQKIRDFLDDRSDLNDAGGEPTAPPAEAIRDDMAQTPTDIS